jgi:hypothetical protein
VDNQNNERQSIDVQQQQDAATSSFAGRIYAHWSNGGNNIMADSEHRRWIILAVA